MGLWDKLHTELNRAGKAAQGAIDEGRLRLEIFRVRQLADKAAQALGYAVYRANTTGEALDAATMERLTATLREHEADAARLEGELKSRNEPGRPDAAPNAPGASASGSSTEPPGASGA